MSTPDINTLVSNINSSGPQTQTNAAPSHQMNSLKVKRMQDNNTLRINLTIWAAAVVSVWLIAVIMFLVKNEDLYHLSDTVIVALLGTTTVNVLGLMLIVLKDIFNSNDADMALVP